MRKKKQFCSLVENEFRAPRLYNVIRLVTVSLLILSKQISTNAIAIASVIADCRNCWPRPINNAKTHAVGQSRSSHAKSYDIVF